MHVSLILILFCLLLVSLRFQSYCAFIGEEETNSFYRDGDVVLGGVFPLHYTRVSSLPTYTSKPEPGSHK
ncbi:unnamed protein product [Arctogadus glacialis]